MARARNPLSKRNESKLFTGAEVARTVARLAASKKARIVRERGEFDGRDLRSYITSPLIPPAAYSWSLADIVGARNEQLVGRFRNPARLAESFGTDGSLFTARGVRLAPVQSLGVDIEAGSGPKADRIADEAKALFGLNGIAYSSETDTTIRSHLADHGVAFACINRTVRGDGSRVDYKISAWPIEFVWRHAVQGAYYTQARIFDDVPEDPPAGGLYMPGPQNGLQPLVPITHGDGRWIIFRKSELLPHRLDAALLPAALVWARIAFALRDWSKGATAHGNPKVVGELPPETALTDAAGNLTREAERFLELVQAVASQDTPIGIRPAGSKIDYTTNTSKAWEVWEKLVDVSQRDAARIYLGTDGVLGAQGGAPGVDISALMGVATSKIESDLACIERSLQSGAISPWCAENFGDDKSAPLRSYVFPDADEARVREDFAKRNAAFLADVQGYRAAGFVVDQALVAKVAGAHGVPMPMLPAAEAAKAPSIALAPTDVAKVVRVNEARASAGVGPLLDAAGAKDARGEMLLSELDAPPATPAV